MKYIIKYILILVIFLFSLVYLINLDEEKKKEKISTIHKIEKENTNKRLNSEIKKLQKYLLTNSDFNTKIVFLIDMKIPSNKNRFFVYDLEKNKILTQGLVAHGSGSEKNKSKEGKLYFSNVDNSLCTSLGKYEIMNSYYGDFGKAYKLKGLDNTNSNAFSRNIVLHKYSKVPFDEQINPICLSYGCPMVNETFFNGLEKILDNSRKNILLNIYY